MSYSLYSIIYYYRENSLLPTRPIPVLTCSGTSELALHRQGSYSYLDDEARCPDAPALRHLPES